MDGEGGLWFTWVVSGGDGHMDSCKLLMQGKMLLLPDMKRETVMCIVHHLCVAFIFIMLTVIPQLTAGMRTSSE